MASAANEVPYTIWVDINSNSSTNLIQEIKANAATAVSPTPFSDSTVNQVYDFFKAHLRPADDDPRGIYHTFTYFTFLVVDAECLESDPWQCVSAPSSSLIPFRALSKTSYNPHT